MGKGEIDKEKIGDESLSMEAATQLSLT